MVSRRKYTLIPYSRLAALLRNAVSLEFSGISTNPFNRHTRLLPLSLRQILMPRFGDAWIQGFEVSGSYVEPRSPYPCHYRKSEGDLWTRPHNINTYVYVTRQRPRVSPAFYQAGPDAIGAATEGVSTRVISPLFMIPRSMSIIQ